jgi:hypothetical protein
MDTQIIYSYPLHCLRVARVEAYYKTVSGEIIGLDADFIDAIESQQPYVLVEFMPNYDPARVKVSEDGQDWRRYESRDPIKHGTYDALRLRQIDD